MKKIIKGLGTLVLCFFFAYISIQSAYAAGFGGGSRGGSFGNGGFGPNTIKTEISYDALSELCILINDQITQGLYDSVPPFSESSGLAATVRYDSVNGYYVISVKSGVTYYNFLNNSGGVYCAYKGDLEVDPDADYGDQVLMWLHNIYDYVSTISHSLTDTDGPFWLWMKKFDTQNDLTNINLELIDLHVEELSEKLSMANINLELIDLGIQDVIEAIEGISISGDGDGSPVVFDTLPITDKLTTLYEAIERFHYDFNVFASQSGEDLDYSKAIVDAIDQLHYDFDRYFSQFGNIIEYGEVEYVVEGQQTVEWDDNYYSYVSGDLTSGSSVRTFRLPTLYGVTGSPASIGIRDNDGYPSIYADDVVYDDFSYSGRGIPGSFYLSYNGNRHSVNLSELADSGSLQGKSVTILDGVPGGEISVTFLGKTTQSGTPTESNPIPLRNLGVRAGVISATVSNGEGRSHVINAALPDSGLAGLPVDGNYGNYTDENGQCWIADFVYDGKYCVQYIKTVTFDGSADEGWFNNYVGTPNYEFCCDVGRSGDVFDGVIMSDRYTPALVNSTTTDKGIYIYNSTFADVARICVRGDNTFSSVVALRAWISEHPFTVSYALTVPIVHELRVPSEYMGSLTGTIYEESATEVTADSFMFVDYASKNPIIELYMDEDNFWRVRYADGTILHLTDSAVVSALNDAFSLREYTSADSILLHNGLNSVFVTNGGTLTMNLLRGSKFVNWFVNWQHGSRDWLDGRLATLESTLSNLDFGDGGNIDIDNSTNIEVNEDNDAYNVFYVTDVETGEETTIVDLSGDTLKVFGKLLNFLYQVGFKGALDGAAGSIENLTDFYMDSAEGSADVWAS